MTCDSNWANVVLLLPFDGTNGQTTTADISSYAQPTTINAAKAGLTTTSPKFGTASLLAGGSNFNNSFACQTPYASGSVLDIFTTTEYTVECWLQIANAGTAGDSHTIVAYGDDGAGGSAACLQAYVTVFGDGLTATLAVADQSAFGTGITVSSTISLVVGTWYHFALVHHGALVTGYFDGVAQFTAGWNPGTYTHSGSTAVCIGSFSRTGAFGVALQIDEFRVTAGLARYTANFTPTSIEFPTTACTVTVPDVSDTPLATAETTLTGGGFVVGTVTGVCSDTIAVGNVVSTSPAIGSPVLPGATINIFEANGACPAMINLETKFVAPLIGKAIMVANPGDINPRVWPPQVDTTIRVAPGTVL